MSIIHNFFVLCVLHRALCYSVYFLIVIFSFFFSTVGSVVFNYDQFKKVASQLFPNLTEDDEQLSHLFKVCVHILWHSYTRCTYSLHHIQCIFISSVSNDAFFSFYRFVFPQIFDHGGDNSVDFREMMVGLSILTKGSLEERMERKDLFSLLSLFSLSLFLFLFSILSSLFFLLLSPLLFRCFVSFRFFRLISFL